jgi:cation transporter-like permease
VWVCGRASVFTMVLLEGKLEFGGGLLVVWVAVHTCYASVRLKCGPDLASLPMRTRVDLDSLI